MENFVQTFLRERGYTTNDKARVVIRACDDWYTNRCIEDFHQRKTVQGTPYELLRTNFAKRCCADDANLCEVAEVNGGENETQHEYLLDILEKNHFLTMYRKQIENVSAKGTAACYVRLDQAEIAQDGSVRGGRIRLNYTPLYNFLKEMPYEALWCIISLRTKIHERRDLIRPPYYTTTNT